MSRSLALLASLAQSRWSLTRTLRSSNPDDFNGQLHGSASFTSLGRVDSDSASPANPAVRDWLYSEEGEMPACFSKIVTQPGMRWRKKYIWRLDGDVERISVWFVKIAPGPEEADYLFHNFEVIDSAVQESDANLVTPPTPPTVSTVADEVEVVEARGSHLCINDMYRTAYAFRIRSDTGEVLSWASRHVVHGPKKDQDIVNEYRREQKE